MYCNSFGNVLMYVHVFCVRGVSNGLWACPHACSCYTTHTCTHTYVHTHTHTPLVLGVPHTAIYHCLVQLQILVLFAICFLQCQCLLCAVPKKPHTFSHIYNDCIYSMYVCMNEIYTPLVYSIFECIMHVQGTLGPHLPHAALSKHETKLGVGMVVGQGDGAGRRREW